MTHIGLRNCLRDKWEDTLQIWRMMLESQSWNRDQKAKFPKVWGLRETNGFVCINTQALHLEFLLSFFLPTFSLNVFWSMRGLVIPFVYSCYHPLSFFTPVMSQKQLKAVPLSSTMPHQLQSFTKEHVMTLYKPQ